MLPVDLPSDYMPSLFLQVIIMWQDLEEKYCGCKYVPVQNAVFCKSKYILTLGAYF